MTGLAVGTVPAATGCVATRVGVTRIAALFLGGARFRAVPAGGGRSAPAAPSGRVRAAYVIDRRALRAADRWFAEREEPLPAVPPAG